MRRLLVFLVFCISAQALEKQPWFGDVYEFHWLSGYEYSRYSKVQGATSPLASPSNNHLLFTALDFSFSPEWSLDMDLEFADTPKQDFSFRSVALQARYLWMDDIVGDTFSLATGISGRYVGNKSVHDISSPYHGDAEVVGSLSIGKEWDSFQFWRFRTWGFASLGIANLGSPWVEALFAIEGNLQEEHKCAFFLKGIHGYGKENQINIEKFRGYGRIRQKALDIRFRYGYRLGVWGTLRFEYERRVLSKRGPERVNSFMVSYLLPFSF